MVTDIDVLPVKTLSQVVAYLTGFSRIAPEKRTSATFLKEMDASRTLADPFNLIEKYFLYHSFPLVSCASL